MKFKTPNLRLEIAQSCEKLNEVLKYFERLSEALGIEPVVTRVWQAVCGDSGVHEVHRAIDLRDETIFEGDKHSFLYTPEDTALIVAEMNRQFPRDDSKLVCIHHSFDGGPYHFHLQIPYKWSIE